jgi:hypothetical protein
MSKCLEMLVNMVLYDSRDNYCNTNGSQGDANGSQKLYIQEMICQHNSFLLLYEYMLDYMFRPFKWSSSGLS